jgi:hypothetical protein
LTIAAIAAATFGCGLRGYDGPQDGGTSSGTDGSNSASDGGSVPSELALLVEVECQDGTSELMIPESALIAAGQSIFVRVFLRTGNSSPSEVTDSRGNSYRLDVSAINDGGANARVDLFSSRIDTALGAGDIITATHPDVRSSGVVASLMPDGFDLGSTSSTAVGNGSTVAGEIFGSAGSLVVAALAAANHPRSTPAEGWDPMPTSVASCGGAPGNSITHGAATSVGSEGIVGFEAQLSTSDRWALGMVAYPPR